MGGSKGEQDYHTERQHTASTGASEKGADMGRRRRKREQKQAGEEELGELGELGWGTEARAAGSELIASVALLHQR